MTLAATTENASSLDSDPTVQSGSGIGAGGEARQAGESVLSGKQPLTLEGKKDEARPWWKTRGAYISYAVAAVVLLVLFVVLLVLGLLGYLEPDHQGPHVNLGYATYVGTTLDSGINRFLGMRYAAPPVGDLRWRAPTAPPTSTRRQQAKQFGPICLGISAAYPSSSEDEDCLFVNVWAPKGLNTTSNLPVWLFIQGGGYVTNSNADWDGEEVIQRSGNSIVFVNFNYRVAMWGFLASSRVQDDGALNAGLLDQRFLMEWVKTNIASFGGDPNNVIIHGASAGAGSVALHLTAYGGRDDGLFTAGIAESVFFPAQPFVPELEYQFDRLVNATDCATAAATDQMACLRALDTAALQAQNVPSPFPGRTAAPLPHFYWTPCIDGDFIQDLPYNLFARGLFVDVPLLFGNDNDEGRSFAADAATSADMANFLRNNYPLLTAADADALVELYPLEPAAARHAAWFPSASTAYGEATFICPAISILGAYAVFGPASLAGEAAPPSYLTYNAPVVPLVMGYFLSFVRTGDPNALRAPGAPVIVIETNNTRMEEVGPAQALRCRFWKGLAPRTQQKIRRGAAVDLWG
ncbi:hypothetical protein VSDG_02114 [Cytospora chrysosperma]|uniref:Carboxylic ester hydrolase n=1 Tax=Cytospora chrysosperma TaxID=252740 RepID=A0A423WDT1_CYTCH|nr:hypothetical protein VSDG_02114 [Valsa sordida]